jgi:hypothetical protein
MVVEPNLDYSLPLLGGLMALLVLAYANRFLASPALAIILRWGRWAAFSFGAAYLVQSFGWSGRPYWVLVLSAFLIWVLLETLYTWFAISALSLSPIPLFPRFSANQTGEEWPARKRMMALKDWLRLHGFRQVEALVAEIGNEVNLRVSIYQDEENLLRVQILFLPVRGGMVTTCFSVSSQTTDSLRYTTDNLFLPFGGFYPEEWSIQRLPLVRSLSRLIANHRRRFEREGKEANPWEDEPLNDLNLQQNALEKVNTDLGFLFPRNLREDYGKMTFEGRYRVWKEVWMLNYLGVPRRY